MTRRDDFPKGVIDLLAKRAGYCCSNPNCRIPTMGAAMDSEGFISIGVAAHITAAAPGGPRYDSLLSPEQRRHINNGIHLCQKDARLIDANTEYFTVERLLGWKKAAEARSFEVLTGKGQRVDGPALTQGGDLAAVLAAAAKDVESFKREETWPRHPITLKLRMVDGSDHPFDVSGLAAAVTAFNEIALIAPPGIGKTTTLLQTAEAINARGEAAAIFVPLGDWSTEAESLFGSILRRGAFAGISEDQLKKLAEAGQLVLLLDGWNELDPESQKRLASTIRRFRRDYPDLGFIISTRRHALTLPIAGRLVEIDLLSEDQQLELARGLRGAEGESILDHAWRTPGVRELVAMPLYLTSLLAGVQGERLPTTKEEVLRLFIAAHESPHDKALALRQALQGFHLEIMVALATGATNAANTSISDADARAAVARAIDQLVDAGQMRGKPEPMQVLDLLVSQHVLIRLGPAAKSVSFQHQQFQEWYASFEVERLIQAAQSNNDVVPKALRETVLNSRPWEEPILFACERMSRQDEAGAQAIAATITETIGIDPMLAALMVQRSSDRVWELVRGAVLDFVERWHTAGTADRALRFMIDTGRADFADKVWRVIADPNDQVHLQGLRAGRRFRPSVLGPDAQVRIAALPEKVREQVVSELAYRSGMDGMELAVDLARADADSGLKTRIVEALLFRRADRLAVRVLETAPDEVWRDLARSGFTEAITVPKAVARLREERKRYLQEEADLVAKLNFMVDERRGGGGHDHGAEVQRLIADPAFPIREQHTSWAINAAHERYPREVTAALLNRLENGLEIPHGMAALITAAGIVRDEGPIVDLVLRGDASSRVAGAAVGLVGPDTTGRLFDMFLSVAATVNASSKPLDEALRKRYQDLHALVLRTPVDSLVEAVVRRGDTTDPAVIMLLAELIGEYGGFEGKGPLRFEQRWRDPLCEVLARWADILLASPDGTRKHFAELARAIGRVADLRLLPVLQRLLAEDLARWRRARDERARSGGTQQHPDAYMSWTNWYAGAFAAFDGEEVTELMKAWLADVDFGAEAAAVLVQHWERQNGGPAGKAYPVEPSFPKARERRLDRERTKDNPVSTPTADVILAVAESLAQPEAGPEQQALAMRLTAVAVQLPHGTRSALIDLLLGLPQPRTTKQKLLKALAAGGEVIPAAAVMEGFTSLLEDAKTRKWLIQDNQRWELDAWLELFPLSDDPLSVMTALGMLEPRLKQPWHLRGMLSALGQAPATAIEQVLVALADPDPRFVQEHHWTVALEQCGAEAAARLVLDLVVRHGHGGGGFAFSRLFARAVRTSPAFRAEVYARYEQGPPAVSQLLEHVIAEAADEAAVRLLIQHMAAQGRSYAGSDLHRTLEHVALGQQPAGSAGGIQADAGDEIPQSGAYEVFSVPVTELRKSLFAMVGANMPQSALAAACLNAIDEIRDDYGAAESEPRHPDITSGRPWPVV